MWPIFFRHALGSELFKGTPYFLADGCMHNNPHWSWGRAFSWACALKCLV